MKHKWIGIALVIFSAPRPLAREPAARASEFVVWNVGQGLWTTLIDGDRCLHFDTGGERAPWRALHAACGDKNNIVHFSHWDLDHISFAGRLARRLSSACLDTAPAGEGSAHKKKLVHALTRCAEQDSATRTVEGPTHGLRSNDRSHVFIAGSFASRALTLIPGDSTSHEEKFWARRLPGENLWLLVLGHHGSRTSTSRELLRSLPRVRMAIASSRQAKYGHPHREVAQRLKMAGIALLRTEDWGTLRFEFPKSSPPARAGRDVSRVTDDKVCTRGSGCGRPVRRSRAHRRR